MFARNFDPQDLKKHCSSKEKPFSKNRLSTLISMLDRIVMPTCFHVDLPNRRFFRFLEAPRRLYIFIDFRIEAPRRLWVCFRLLVLCFRQQPSIPAPDLVFVVLGKFFSQFAKRIQELAEDKAENKIPTESHKKHQTTKFSTSKLLFLSQTAVLQKMGGGTPRTGASIK